MRLGGAVLAVLMLSTVLVGIGIALAGTVLPGIVKEFFGDRSGAMTGVYLLAMMVGAAAASAFAVPHRRRDRLLAGGAGGLGRCSPWWGWRPGCPSYAG